MATTAEIVTRAKEVVVRSLAFMIGSYINECKRVAARDGYNNGLQKGLEAGYLKGLQEGAIDGRNVGLKEGEDIGYERGKEDGKSIWEISDNRTVRLPKELDNSVYGPDLFCVDSAKVEQMRREVASAVQRGLISEPTPDQWKMIISEHPSTCVLAGAGSGKSTTLVLRVIFMIAHLRIKLDELTVVSFTCDSCNDLREKLVKLAPHWGILLDKDGARNLVRTFHSVLYRMGKTIFPGVTWFENYGRERNANDDIDNPFASSINRQQVETLKETYLKLFFSNKTFRDAVLAMRRIELERDITVGETDTTYDNWVVRVASERDKVLVGLVNERWSSNGHWPIEGIDPKPYPVFNVDGNVFYANGRLLKSGLPVFLGAGSDEDLWRFSNNEMIGQGRESIAIPRAIGVKRNIVSWRHGSGSIYLASSRVAARITDGMRFLEVQQACEEAPMFEVRLSGEKARVGLLEAFYAQASFIESMGLEVTEFVHRMRAFRSPDIDQSFCTAISLFWPQFEKDLARKRVMTFNRGFNLLGNDQLKIQARQNLIPLYRPLTHLLIDEFQDISSQIVRWVVYAQRQLAVDNRRPSIMAIGDDWQSIYGWRGSSPEFFMAFNHYFRVHPDLGSSKVCPMGENFRSIPDIVLDGARLLSAISIKTDKPVTSNVAKRPGDHGVLVVHQKQKGDGEYMDEIVHLINEQYDEMIVRGAGDKRKILVIARTNDAVKILEDRVGKRSGIYICTIHRSKGLQAEVAIICEDCSSDDVHPIRDRVYGLMSGFKCKSYGDAMRDEAIRLAYVAVTRGIRRVYWFAGKAEGAARLLRN